MLIHRPFDDERQTTSKRSEKNQGSMTARPVRARFPPAITNPVFQGEPSRQGGAALHSKASSSAVRFAALVAMLLTATVREVKSRDVYEDGSTGQSLPGEHVNMCCTLAAGNNTCPRRPWTVNSQTSCRHAYLSRGHPSFAREAENPSCCCAVGT